MMNLKYEERMFLIVSIIRLLGESDFNIKNVEGMLKTSKTVRNILSHGGTITDDEILKQYDITLSENLEEIC